MKSRRFISDIIQNQHRVNEIIDRFKDWKSLCPRPEASGRFLVVPQKRNPDYLMIVRIFLLNGIFMYYVYIIYSLTIDRYYIGQTDNIEERMEQHKSGFFLHSYTSKTKDWKIVLSINCSSRKQSVNIESYIVAPY